MTDYRNNLNGGDRARALYYFFGYGGGTIHQLSQATGVNVHELLTAPLIGDNLTGGFSAVRTCAAQWRVERLAPAHKGDWTFWRDVIAGFWATGPLDEVQA